MLTIQERYQRDPQIRALVNNLENYIHELQFTPTEIRDCAMLAAINYEMHRTRPNFGNLKSHGQANAQQPNTAS